MYSCQTHFDFTYLGSEVYLSRVTPISFGKKWSWPPCKNCNFWNYLTRAFRVIAQPCFAARNANERFCDPRTLARECVKMGLASTKLLISLELLRLEQCIVPFWKAYLMPDLQVWTISSKYLWYFYNSWKYAKMKHFLVDFTVMEKQNLS